MIEILPALGLPILALLVVYVALTVSAKREKKNQEKNEAIKNQILASGQRGEATIVSAAVSAASHVAKGFSKGQYLEVEFRIKILETGEEFDFSRDRFFVPIFHLSDFKQGCSQPVTVHKDNRSLVLFDFDKDKSIADSQWFFDPD